MLRFFIIASFMLFTISFLFSNNVVLVDSLQLEEPTYWTSYEKIESGFLAVNQFDETVEYWDNNGKLITTYGNRGKGPGEFDNIYSLTTNGKDIFVPDLDINRVVHLQLIDDEIKFISQFTLDIRPRKLEILGDNLLAVTISGLKNFAIYDFEGKQIHLSNLSKNKDLKSKYHFDAQISQIAINRDGYFVFCSSLDAYPFFCKFNYDTNEYDILKEVDIKDDYRIEYEVTPRSSTISGLWRIYKTNDSYLFLESTRTRKQSFYRNLI